MRAVVLSAAAAAAGTALHAPPGSCGHCAHSLQTKFSAMKADSS
jgi:hypothetical protein